MKPDEAPSSEAKPAAEEGEKEPGAEGEVPQPESMEAKMKNY